MSVASFLMFICFLVHKHKPAGMTFEPCTCTTHAQCVDSCAAAATAATSLGTVIPDVFFIVNVEGTEPAGHEACWYKEFALLSLMTVANVVVFIVSFKMTVVLGVKFLKRTSQVEGADVISPIFCPEVIVQMRVLGGNFIFFLVLFVTFKALSLNENAYPLSEAKGVLESPSADGDPAAADADPAAEEDDAPADDAPAEDAPAAEDDPPAPVELPAPGGPGTRPSGLGDLAALAGDSITVACSSSSCSLRCFSKSISNEPLNFFAGWSFNADIGTYLSPRSNRTSEPAARPHEFGV